MYRFSKWFAALVGLLFVSMLVVSLVAVRNAAGQEQKKTQLEGVWKVAEVVPGKGTPITNPQPGFLIFTKGYYSLIGVTANEPRAAVAPPKEPGKLTDAEKIARFEQWAPFRANAGTYELKGSTLTMNVMVAKSQERMTSAATVTAEIKLEGSNILWLGPSGSGPSALTAGRVKFTRVE